MRVTATALMGVFRLVPTRHHDSRGWFQEHWQAERFSGAVGENIQFLQDNLSQSRHGVLRGLHAQPGQGKLVSVLAGKIFDVAVDVRRDSPSFGQSLGVTLDSATGEQLWLPAGLAHGFLTLSQQAVVHYKVTAFHRPLEEQVLRYDDPRCAIAWPYEQLNAPLVISEKDANGLSWSAFCRAL